MTKWVLGYFSYYFFNNHITGFVSIPMARIRKPEFERNMEMKRDVHVITIDGGLEHSQVKGFICILSDY